MRLSQLFTKTRKNISPSIQSINANLLIRAGYVDQLMAGVYSYLPLGLITLRKIESIVRKHMNQLNSNEILMPTLHPKANWEVTGGWDSIDVLFKIISRGGNEYALGQSEEEIVTPLALQFSKSYRDLPISVYQIHWKYRDELRAKSGILRGREFLMKDMYSFHANQADFDQYYQTVKQAYQNIFTELGLEAKVTEASGGAFSDKISYEFMVLTDAGEDEILYSEQSPYCINLEIAKQKAGDAAPDGSPLKLAKASEVGNVFDLGTKYPKAFGLSFTDESGTSQYPIMGCFGLGISRVMGVIAEKYHDEAGLCWPSSVAPALIHLVSLGGDKAQKEALDFYHKMKKANISILFDDRKLSAGVKFVEADLIGIPNRLTISDKTQASGKVEWRGRNSAEVDLLSIDDAAHRAMELNTQA